MVSDMMGGLVDGATDEFDDAVGDDLTKADQFLEGIAGAFNDDGTPREIDVDAVDAEFVRADDLGTSGGPQDVPASPNLTPDRPGPTTGVDFGKSLEIVMFGRVYRDRVRNFSGDDELDDVAGDDLSEENGNRAVFYRAALQREAILLGGFARSSQIALAAKEMQMGNSDSLLESAAALLGGGAAKKENVAASTDLQPFLDKIRDEAWTPINEEEIEYQKLHEAGVALHEVRVNLRKYLRDQLDAAKNPPKASAGLLEQEGAIPLIGQIPLPGEIGEGIDFMKKVTGKLHDVQTALIFDLVLSMQGPIEEACVKATIDSIRTKRPPIYHTWYLPPEEEEEEETKVVNTAGEDLLGGGLSGLDEKLDKEVFEKADEKANSALEKPLEVIDFFKADKPKPPTSQWVPEVFQGEAVAGTGVWLGSDFLAKKAVASLARAMGSGTIPGFMTGFVGTIVTEIFGVCTGFLRSVYDKLCCVRPREGISTAGLVEAGRNNLVSQIIDILLEKTGLDEMLSKLTYEIPEPPIGLPGITWPKETVSVEPILAELKRVLADKAKPALDPVIEYTMAGLASRLTATRAWAGPTATTMEAHLAQLPGEIAIMFRNLFGPLWSLITETLMGAVNNAMSSVLGPLGEAAGLPSEAFGKVTGFIDDAKNKANQAVQYAENVENAAGALMESLETIEVGGDQGLDDVGSIMNAGNALKNAVEDNPFASDEGPMPTEDPPPTTSFPSNRKKKAKGKPPSTEDIEKVKESWKWEEARRPDQVPGASLQADPEGAPA